MRVSNLQSPTSDLKEISITWDIVEVSDYCYTALELTKALKTHFFFCIQVFFRIEVASLIPDRSVGVTSKSALLSLPTALMLLRSIELDRKSSPASQTFFSSSTSSTCPQAALLFRSAIAFFRGCATRMEAREEERGLTPAGEGAQSELAIVSLLPSLTEVVAELGLSAKIVGMTHEYQHATAELLTL